MEKFVKEFLKIGNLNSAQKDKMIELFERDRFQNFENKILDKVQNSQKNLADKIQKLEDKIFNSVPNSEIEKLTEIQKVENQKKTNIQEETETSEKPEIYTDPFGEKSLSKFLRAYNQDNLLKYTWHTIDKETIKDGDEELNVKEFIKKLSNTEIYCIEAHQKLLKERFEELTKKFFIDPQVYALLYAYLTGKNAKGDHQKWSSNDLELNWASEELFKWSDENPDYIPNANGNLKNEQKGKIFKLPKPFNSNINGKRIRDFSELIIHCKNLFHIRRDNSLNSILEYVINQNKWENIEFEFNNFNDYVEIFTNVDKLIQFFTEYINLICEKFGNQENKIILSLVEEGSFINFIIHHIDQTYLKTSESTLSRRGSTYTSLKNKINGMCELWLEADFPNEPSYRINIWTGKEWNDKEKIYVSKPMQKEKIEKVNGVKHILKFKR